MMQSLAQHYTAKLGGSQGFLLLYNTGFKSNNSEVDVPLIYADYYFTKALLRRRRLATNGL